MPKLRLCVASLPKVDPALLMPVRTFVKVWCDGEYNGSFDVSLEAMHGDREVVASEEVLFDLFNVYADGAQANTRGGIKVADLPSEPCAVAGLWSVDVQIEGEDHQENLITSTWESDGADVAGMIKQINETVVQSATPESTDEAEPAANSDDAPVSSGIIAGDSVMQPGLSIESGDQSDAVASTEASDAPAGESDQQ